jgi:hypothetical protein
MIKVTKQHYLTQDGTPGISYGISKNGWPLIVLYSVEEVNHFIKFLERGSEVKNGKQ